METTQLPVSGHDAWLGAAGYLAIVAYPGDLSARDRFVDAAKAWMIRKHAPKLLRASDVTPMVRWLRAIRADGAYNRLAMASKRIETRRMPAAHMARSMLFASVSARDRVSINGLAGGYALPDRANIITRVWGETKPVLHLALALLVARERLGVDGVEVPNIGEMIALGARWLPEATAQSEVWRCTLPRALRRSCFDDGKAVQVLAASF
jgi:hypothetical protein